MKHKVHVMHFGSEDTRQWVDDHLTGMLHQMNVEEEHAIAGRLWTKEITRMIKEGFKVIIVINRETITKNDFNVLFNQIILTQNYRKPCLILITLDNIDEDQLKSYIVLRHDDGNLYDRLKQAIFS